MSANPLIRSRVGVMSGGSDYKCHWSEKVEQARTCIGPGVRRRNEVANFQ